VPVSIGGAAFWQLGDDLYPDYLHHGAATAFIQHVAKRFCVGRGLDIGCGKWPLEGALPIDNDEHANALKLDHIADGSMDYIYSSHCLEHLEYADAKRALKLWGRKLKVDGVVFLYLPHPTMRLWNPGSAWVGSGHKWIPEQQSALHLLWEAGCKEIGRSEWPDAYWSFYVVGRKVMSSVDRAADMIE
jgi:SAM-dependent methyltransferase